MDAARKALIGELVDAACLRVAAEVGRLSLKPPVSSGNLAPSRSKEVACRVEVVIVFGWQKTEEHTLMTSATLKNKNKSSSVAQCNQGWRLQHQGGGKSVAVLRAAYHHFSRYGFDGVNMDEVAATAGVSKATVYAKFGSKDGLFLAVLEDLRLGMPTPNELMLSSAKNVATHLRVIAKRLLQLTLRPSTLGIYRMLALPIDTAPHLAQTFWTMTVDPYREMMQEILCDAARCGQLSLPDPALAASQFFGLVVGDPTLRMLHSARFTMARNEIKVYTDAAVALFLARYGRAA
jgi:TetR/AcrR family transcriptional repressor of mexJK operon